MGTVYITCECMPLWKKLTFLNRKQIKQQTAESNDILDVHEQEKGQTKNVIVTLQSHNSDFFSGNCKFTFLNSDYLFQNRYIFTTARKKVWILR